MFTFKFFLLNILLNIEFFLTSPFFSYEHNFQEEHKDVDISMRFLFMIRDSLIYQPIDIRGMR